MLLQKGHHPHPTASLAVPSDCQSRFQTQLGPWPLNTVRIGSSLKSDKQHWMLQENKKKREEGNMSC
jgi:hypothetical protein